MPRSSSQFTLRKFGAAAFLWSLAFGALNFYWALGGDLGSDQLSRQLVERFEARETEDLAILWTTGALKIIGGLVPFALAFALWKRVSRRLLRLLCWLGGIFLSLYGIGDIVSGTIRAIDGEGNNAIWYATLWGPIWLLGGLLFLGTAWTYGRQVKRGSW